MICQLVAQRTELWPIDKIVSCARNPRKNGSAVDRMYSSIREFGQRGSTADRPKDILELVHLGEVALDTRRRVAKESYSTGAR